SSEHPAKSEAWKIPLPRYKLSMKWKDDSGVITRWADTAPVTDAGLAISRYSMEDPQFVVKNLFSRIRYSKVLHAAVREGPAGVPISIHASLLGNRQDARLSLQYRLAGQGFRFTSLEMIESKPNVYSATLPSAPAGTTIFYYLHCVDQTDYF